MSWPHNHRLGRNYRKGFEGTAHACDVNVGRHRIGCYGAEAMNITDPSPRAAQRPLSPDLAWIDEYRWTGATDDGSMIVAARYSRHPNRGIEDASLTLSIGGEQTSVHLSARIPAGEPLPLGPLSLGPLSLGPLSLGPLSLEPILAIDPIEANRSNPIGLHLQLDAVPGLSDHETPSFRVDGGGDWSTPEVLRCPAPGSRLDIVRRHAWSTGEVHGQPITVLASHLIGTRRSRALDPALGRAPDHHLPSYLWWSTDLQHSSNPPRLEMSQSAIEITTNSNGHGPTLGSPVHLEWARGTRWPATIRHETAGELPPLGRLLLTGLGYHSNEWEPGRWHDELAIGIERWHLDTVASQGIRFLHVLTVVGPQPFGFVETLPVGVIPSRGLAGFIDGG